MDLQELIDNLYKEDWFYIKDNACPLTAIDNYNFGDTEDIKKDTNDYVITDVRGEIGAVVTADERGYLQGKESIFTIYSEKFIYVDEKTKYDSNPIYRLDIEKADFNLIESIERDHEFKNRITVAYKYLDRIFVAHEKQSADPFEVKPREKALKYFDNEDWKGLVRLTL